MIAVDTSALMAILQEESEAEACTAALEVEGPLLISAVTLAEAMIVARRRNVGDAMVRLIDELGFEVVNVTAASARRVTEAYDRWGKGVHPAALNFADCFAYELATARECPLLFVGTDFAKTDVEAAL
jgi:ribonuclease VapC